MGFNFGFVIMFGGIGTLMFGVVQGHVDVMLLGGIIICVGGIVSNETRIDYLKKQIEEKDD